MRARDAAGLVDFESWLAAREGALHRTAFLLTGDLHAAEDLVQVTLTKLYLAWARIERREQVDAYARKILLHEHRSVWRRAWRRLEVVTDDLPERVAPTREHDRVHDEVWDVLATLPPRQRAVVVLRYYEDLTEAQTAEALGITVGTVKSQAHKALAALRGRVERPATRLPDSPEGAR